MLQILICQYKDFKTNIVPDLISFTQHGIFNSPKHSRQENWKSRNLSAENNAFLDYSGRPWAQFSSSRHSEFEPGKVQWLKWIIYFLSAPVWFRKTGCGPECTDNYDNLIMNFYLMILC